MSDPLLKKRLLAMQKDLIAFDKKTIKNRILIVPILFSQNNKTLFTLLHPKVAIYYGEYRNTDCLGIVNM